MVVYWMVTMIIIRSPDHQIILPHKILGVASDRDGTSMIVPTI
jgi:hypothetical protein